MPADREGLAENWQRTLSQIPTQFGRLAYLASLRDANKGTYQHFGLSQRIGEPATDALIRQSHLSAFQDWLCLGLTEQWREVDEYFASLEGAQRDVISTWLKLGPYRTWVPEESRDVERRLFYSDLEAILERFRIEYGVAYRDPDS